MTAAEPLLDFPRGALVHFAVSSSEVKMTTRLQGAATTFLPFTQGNDGGAGNPMNYSGHYNDNEVNRVVAVEMNPRSLDKKRVSEKSLTL